MRPDHVTIHADPLPSPPLVVMTLNLRTLPNPKTHQNEVRGNTVMHVLLLAVEIFCTYNYFLQAFSHP